MIFLFLNTLIGLLEAEIGAGKDWSSSSSKSSSSSSGMMVSNQKHNRAPLCRWEAGEGNTKTNTKKKNKEIQKY